MREGKTEIIQLLENISSKDSNLTKIALKLHDYIRDGNVDGIESQLIKKEILDTIKLKKSPEEAGNLGLILKLTGLVKDGKAEVTFNDLNAKFLNKDSNGTATVEVTGTATTKITVDGKENKYEENVEETIYLEKEDGEWKIVEITDKKN
jgi:hypothetical protein